MANSFSNKAEFMAHLWTVLLYGDAEQAQFAHMFGVSFPLAMLIDSGDVDPLDSGIAMIEDLWSDACEFLGIDPLADYVDYLAFSKAANV